MVNIISKLEQRNKNLLEENENLKQQLIELANKEQDLNLRIYNTVENAKENKSPEIAGTLMTLEQCFPPRINSLLKILLRVVLNEYCLVVILSVMFLDKIKNLKKRMLS